MLLGSRFDFAKLTQGSDHHFHDLVPFFNVSHLASAEQNADLHFILVLQKFFCLAKLGANIFLTSLGPKTNLFRLGVRLPGVLLFVLVVLVLAVIHDSADRGPLVGGDFHKIQARIASPLESLLCGNDSQLLSLFAHDSNRCDTNVLIDAY